MNRGMAVLMLAVALALAGCARYAASTPVQHLEGDNAGNYKRIFGQETPAGVEVVHSVIATYGFRPGVVTTDDFEFELLAGPDWIKKAEKKFHLRDGEGFAVQLAARREQAKPWYAPGEIGRYELYRDVSSVGYVHMLVEKEPLPDGRRRVFLSKH